MSGSGPITRRGFDRRRAPRGLRRARRFARRALPGSAKARMALQPVVPGKTFSFPADHGPHPEFRIEWWYVTANLVDGNGAAYGAQWTLFRQAIAPGAQQEGWANQQIWMGHAAVTRADTHRFSEDLCARRRRPGRRRGTTVSRLDRCLGDARARCDERQQHRAARTHRVRRRFQLRAASRRRPAAGAAGRRRLQPQIGARAGLVLLQPAALSRRRAASPSTTSRSRSPGRPGWIANGAASRWRSDQTGWDWLSLHFKRRRQADAVPDAPDRRPSLRLRQMDRARRQGRTDSLPPTSP